MGRSGLDSLLARSDQGSLHALQVGQVWVRFILYRQIRFGFVPCLAGRSGQSVVQSGGSTMPAHYRWSSGGRSVAGIRQSVAGPLRFSELVRS